MKKDLTGQKFGKLLVVNLSHHEGSKYYWNCLCECGNSKISWTSSLTRGKVKSCGCSKPNLIGMRFGNGIVLDKATNRKENNRQEWVLKCDCGNIYQAKTSQLTGKAGHRTISCKCKRYDINNRPFTKDPNVIGYKELSMSIWNIYKTNSRKKNLDFSVTSKYAYDLYLNQNKKCVYTGWDINFGKIVKIDNKNKVIDKTASLDRIDNSKGYIEGNIQWVHKHINSMKNSHSEQYFIELCSAVYKNRKEV